MNLAELRREAESALRWAPTTAAHKSDLTERLNRALYDLAVGEPTWPWALKRQDITLYTDEVAVQSATFTNGARIVSLTTGTAKTKWNGHYVDAPDGVRYEVMESTDGGGSFALTTDYAGATTTTTFTVRYRWFDLPVRCADVQKALVRDHGVVHALSRTMEYEIDLGRDDDTRSAPPDCFIIEEQSPVVEASTAPTITASNAASTLTVGTTYRYFYTVYGMGREGPPSELVERAPTASQGTNIVNVPATDFGTVKRIYRSAAKSPLYHLVGTANASTTTLTDNGLSAGARYDEAHYRRRFRVWPLPSSDTVLDMLFVQVPRAMLADSDQPPFDPAYHVVLPRIVAHSILAELGEASKARSAEVLKDEVENRMRARYFGTSAENNLLPSYHGSESPFPNAVRTILGRGTPSIT